MLEPKNIELEFPTITCIIGEGSFLDKDDINGPGYPMNPEAPDPNDPQANPPITSNSNFMRRTGDRSIDFALYKISQFSLSPDLAERLKFVKELDELSLQLGAFNATHIFSILQKLVTHIKVEDSIEIRIELGSQIGCLAKVFIEEFKIYDAVIKNLIPILDKLLEDKNQDVIKAACGSAIIVAELLTIEDRGSVILTMILRILHDEEEETRIRALNTLKGLIGLLSADVCECFIMKEAMILASENVVKVRKSVAECIPRLSKEINNSESLQKLIRVFKDLSKDSIWGVRKACAENIVEMFEGLNETFQELYVLAIYQNLLNDKSNSVKQCAMLQLGPCIYNARVSIPDDIVDMFIELSKNSSNKGDFQYHCAYYLPAVTQKLGKWKWEKIRPAVLAILNDSEYKAKKALISGLHEIGKVLQPELATEELSGLYEGIFSESVISKQIALGSLGKFLSVILPEKRLSFIKFIKVLSKFAPNWRIRLAVAEQIKEIIPLFDFPFVLNEFVPIILILSEDKIAKVREASALCIGKLVNLVLKDNIEHYIIESFRDMSTNDNCQCKLNFLLGCFEVIEHNRFIELYGKEFESLCSEKAPNLRILCAKVVKIGDEKSNNFTYWNTLKNKLAHDFDGDVRFEITGKYDMERGIVKLRPNSEKHLQLMTPMFRALFPDDDLDEIIAFNSNSYKQFGYLRASVTPAMNGFVENLSFESAEKSKMLIF